MIWRNAYGTHVDVSSVRHPAYRNRVADWKKWRLTYDGGDEFVQEYLKKYSKREGKTEFEARRELTPTPNFAKAAINDIKNAIFQRLTDVLRIGGPDSYQKAVDGTDFGIDMHGSSMNAFIGMNVLPELLPMAKYGVWVDRPPVGNSLSEDLEARQFIYGYRTEDILAWEFQPHNPREFQSVLLRDNVVIRDGVANMPTGQDVRYRYAYIGADGYVRVQMFKSWFDINGKTQKQQMVDVDDNPTEEEITLDIRVIPFHIFEIQDSLLADVCNHQIALLNLESSDVSYALKANAPFYIEQVDDRGGSSHITPAVGENGEEGEAVAGKVTVEVGGTEGRLYGKNLNAPGFIHPSPEPLLASMKKQQQLKDDIRNLVNLALANAKPRDASAESKQMDERGLEAGLSYIGLVLEHGERKIAHYWAMYENTKPALVRYPTRYSLGSEEDRRKDVELMGKIRQMVPSKTFQKKITLRMVDRLLGTSLSAEDHEKIVGEIQAAESMTAESEIIFEGVERGLIDLVSAAVLMGWPKEGPEKAAKEHAERLARIAKSQMDATPNGENAGARGINDLNASPGQGGAAEKAASRDNTAKGDVKDRVRGKGENNNE